MHAQGVHTFLAALSLRRRTLTTSLPTMREPMTGPNERPDRAGDETRLVLMSYVSHVSKLSVFHHIHQYAMTKLRKFAHCTLALI